MEKGVSFWVRLGSRCFGGCIRSEDGVTGESDLISMVPDESRMLQLSDYTAKNGNLIPVLPDEIEFRRMDNYHCRVLTIVDQSPIAVRSLEEMTKELSTVKEPVAMVLPPRLPFDLNNEHPSLESEVLSDSEDEGVSRLNSNDSNEVDTHNDCQVDEACYILADRIYQIEKSKLDGRCEERCGSEDYSQTTAPLSPLDASVSTTFEGSKVGSSGYRDCVSCSPGPWEDLDDWATFQLESSKSEVSISSDSEVSRPSLWTSSLTSDVKASNSPIDEHEAIASYLASSVSCVDENDIKSPTENLHHVSAFCDKPPMAFIDPFDERDEEDFWPFAFGAGVWKYMVGSSTTNASCDSFDVNVEGCISSFYSKEGRLCVDSGVISPQNYASCAV
ncbi:uncharacterized protein BXIN_2155 [Babesia sp. Xinjiang]|uniref:uncharacterized protein n=1 Tax=Babesia sp. Xinjiang TaxID=462227 RepID=UPI000A2319F2|nr:uncharacterized protein BXIN_2155 [Babesia sp. Xinjiang]ORM40478.1 hypothetical protein BXIN_2155 [Babesia sp. Xinjiang]